MNIFSIKKKNKLYLRILTRTFLRELKVLVNQLLDDDLTNDLITLVTYSKGNNNVT